METKGIEPSTSWLQIRRSQQSEDLIEKNLSVISPRRTFYNFYQVFSNFSKFCRVISAIAEIRIASMLIGQSSPFCRL